MIVYAPKVKDHADFAEQRQPPRVVAAGVRRRIMQTSFDSLLVALFVALSPLEHEDQPGLHADSFRQGFQQGYERLRLRPEAPDPDQATDCRYFIDTVARSHCVTRTSRALSKAGENAPTFPDRTVWIAPGDPGMPFKIGAGAFR